ncbi:MULTISPECIES: hypothetical protein [unclassified Mycolicibacterium]|uniref:hypothetical protein n=1 Tax=unclassified Mycolicibacterium TaxID=2636767 RepID=UPI001390C25F|nr:MULTISPECIES: hypothetical protein [unclassified Mycolicibacterium]
MTRFDSLIGVQIGVLADPLGRAVGVVQVPKTVVVLHAVPVLEKRIVIAVL